MRLLIYGLILLVSLGAWGARPLHVPWPDTSIARFDRLFAVATALFVILVAIGSYNWKRPQWRDWKTWVAVIVTLYGLFYAMLPIFS